MYRTVSLVLLLAAAVSVVAATDCDTDCGKKAAFKCFGGTCRNPFIFSACMVEKTADCGIKAKIIKMMARQIAQSGPVRDEAKGWTTQTCITAAAVLVQTTAVAFAAPICAAFTVGAVACIPFVTGLGATLVVATCAQLCTDQHLSDCQTTTTTTTTDPGPGEFCAIIPPVATAGASSYTSMCSLSGKSCLLTCSAEGYSGSLTRTCSGASWSLPATPTCTAARLYWQAGPHIRSGILQGPGVDRHLEMNAAYDGRLYRCTMFLVNDWQTLGHWFFLFHNSLFQRALLTSHVTKLVIDAADRMFAAQGNRLYWQAGPHIRSGTLQGNDVDRQLEVDTMYDGPVIDAADRMFAADGNRLYWQAGPHIRSGVLQGTGVNRQLEVDMMYDGPVIDAADRMFAAEGNRLYWQAGPHIRSGVLQGSGVTRQLEVDIMYDGPVINAVDRMFAAQGNRLYWQAGPHIRSGVLEGSGVKRQLQMDLAYEGRVIDANDQMFAGDLSSTL